MGHVGAERNPRDVLAFRLTLAQHGPKSRRRPLEIDLEPQPRMGSFVFPTTVFCHTKSQTECQLDCLS